MDNWINRHARRPSEATWVDIWNGEERITDVWYEQEEFKLPKVDYQGDFSHYEVLVVTHWMHQPGRPQ